MKLAPKIILHAPVSDETLLEEFVEQCIKDGVSLVAIIGTECQRLEDLVDDIIVGDTSSPDRFICTTSHPDESFEDVLDLIRTWEGDSFQEVRL